ncbi:DUF2487 family protein [Calidifontibacillus oryziterrae]|uniref:DUF2487 family protein n=1 Tax=Calidifontibacillus oryziterrae TaxID=1191699 RepID=UPI0002D8A773|nr:DUF2487 family protein [Calidifontibacillus oryziterrae]
MRWITKDIEMFLKAKEYVDTVIVPLVPITLSGDVKPIVEMGEFISLIATELEREYKGRLLVLSAFTYLKNEEYASLCERLNVWYKHLTAEEVKHVVLLTADPDWKLNEKDLEATLLWIPSISIYEIDKKSLEQLVKSQMKQIQTIVMSLWQKEK